MEIEISNSVYEDNYASGDAYVEDLTAPRAHVDARVPDTGKYLTCVGCDQEFFSQSGLSAKCTDCR